MVEGEGKKEEEKRICLKKEEGRGRREDFLEGEEGTLKSRSASRKRRGSGA
jgi:hypothetical protein